MSNTTLFLMLLYGIGKELEMPICINGLFSYMPLLAPSSILKKFYHIRKAINILKSQPNKSELKVHR